MTQRTYPNTMETPPRCACPKIIYLALVHKCLIVCLHRHGLFDFKGVTDGQASKSESTEPLLELRRAVARYSCRSRGCVVGSDNSNGAGSAATSGTIGTAPEHPRHLG